MITRIVQTDDEQGDFVYTRNPENPFKWTLTWPHGTESGAEFDGAAVLWDVSCAVHENVKT